MFGVTISDDYRPVAWMGRYPVDVTTMLVGLHVAAAILTAILVAIGAGSILAYLQFDSAAVWSGQVWRLFTYAFVHAPSGAALVRNRDVHAVRVRPRSRTLYRATCLYWTLPYFAGYARGVANGLGALAAFGCSPVRPRLHFGIFVAFATIYPRAELFLRIMTKWVVLILAAVYTLQLLAYHAWSDLMVVWTSIGAAFLFIEMHGAGPELPWWDALKARFAPRPKFHVVPKMHSSRSAETDDVYTSIDPILDKISKFGIGSLTASERRQLDRERERLLKNSE